MSYIFFSRKLKKRYHDPVGQVSDKEDMMGKVSVRLENDVLEQMQSILGEQSLSEFIRRAIEQKLGEELPGLGASGGISRRVFREVFVGEFCDNFLISEGDTNDKVVAIEEGHFPEFFRRDKADDEFRMPFFDLLHVKTIPVSRYLFEWGKGWECLDEWEREAREDLDRREDRIFIELLDFAADCSSNQSLVYAFDEDEGNKTWETIYEALCFVGAQIQVDKMIYHPSKRPFIDEMLDSDPKLERIKMYCSEAVSPEKIFFTQEYIGNIYLTIDCGHTDRINDRHESEMIWVRRIGMMVEEPDGVYSARFIEDLPKR